jgi:IPT/TIG domain
MRLPRPLTVLALLGVLVPSAAAPALAADPPENIPLGSEPSSCAVETSNACEEWTVGRLNSARAKLGLQPYALPAGFTGMAPDRQTLILADLDRAAYGYTTIYGLNANLSEAAENGVRQGTDPTPPSAGGPWQGFGSDWASTGPLIAYYLWMYDDGYGGPNGDCTSPKASGCWGHRHVILEEGFSLPRPVLLGAATEPELGSALIVSSDGGSSSYYTWAQAQREGAGSEGGSEGGEPAAPSITSISPRSGPVTGGTKVTIGGSELASVKSVHFGPVPASSFTITSPTSIVAVAPAHSAGSLDVTASSTAGTSAVSASDRFNFLPVIDQISPATGATRGGTRVTIHGAGFATAASATSVSFATNAATHVSCHSSSECSATAPAHAAGSVRIKVTVNGATSAPTPADRYTYG